ncbi:MAG: Very-short-patch-repair endonuclease [Chthonomonadaceae bacterium]|nr:Very-short-patch-repair endonuclease [Chthonomonadaceae bacterium]
MENRGIVTGHRWVLKQDMAKTMRREMTPEESLLWKRLRGNRCGGLHFRRQQVIDGFIADFYCHAVALIVEVDGGVHQQQADYDLARDRVLSRRGLRVIRFSNERIHEDLDQVVAEIQTFAATATQVNDLPDEEI